MAILYGCTAPGIAALAPKIVRTYNASQRDSTPNNLPQILSYKPSTADRTALRAASSSSASICVTLKNYWGAVPDIAGCYVCWYHEPDNDNVTGYPADFKTEYGQIITYVMPGLNAGRVHPMKLIPIFTGNFATNSNSTIDQWVNSGVDAVGFDPYGNLALIADSAAYAAHAGKPWLLTEYGTTVNDPVPSDATTLNHMQNAVADWTGVANPPVAITWFDQNYNTLDVVLKTAASAGATTITVTDLPGGNAAGNTDSLANGSTIVIDPFGANPETVATTALSSGAGNSTSYTVHVPALAHSHPAGAVVYLMPKSVAYWAALNGSTPPPYSPFSADSGTSSGSTTVSFTLPTGIVNGSLAVGEVVTNGNATLTLSGSWAEAAGSPIGNGSTMNTHVLTCPVGASDSGTTVTFTLSAGQRWQVKGLVTSGVSTTLDNLASAVVTSTTQVSSITGPNLTPVHNNCLKLAFIGARIPSNGTATVNQDSGDGYSEEVQSSTNNSGNPNVVLDLQVQQLSGQAGVAQGADAFTTTGNVMNSTVVVLTLSPPTGGGSSSSVTVLDDLTVSDILARSQALKSRTVSDSAVISDMTSASHTGMVVYRLLTDGLSFGDTTNAAIVAGSSHTFTTPTVPYPYSLDDPIHLGRWSWRKGVSVLKINGQYVTVEYPTDIQIAQATEVYLGGHTYTVDSTTAAALAAAGYDLDSPDSLPGGGDGKMPPLSYFNPYGGDPGQVGFVPWVQNDPSDPLDPALNVEDDPFPSYFEDFPGSGYGDGLYGDGPYGGR